MAFFFPLAHFSVWPDLWLVSWLTALAWCWHVAVATVKLPTVPNLLRSEFDVLPPGQPSLTVIVPARNEAADIEECLRSLLAQDYEHLQVFAVDDRSTDATGSIMDGIAAEPASQGHLRVFHVDELPAGWMGKTHAMAMAARAATTDWLLFTDGDIFYAPDALRRALVLAERSHADHLVVLPTLILKSPGERMMMSFFQLASLWSARPWRVPDPRATRDFIGIGAFNLIRREVYTAVGGFEGLRMEVLEDIRLGFMVKRAGYAQRVAFGRDLVRVRWAPGVFGIVDGMTKNLFALFRFRPSLLLAACVWFFVFGVGPFAALLLHGGIRVAGTLAVIAILAAYRLYTPRTGIAWGYGIFHPIAAGLFIYALLRSMIVTASQGGVNWRGTFYSLKELRKHCGPLW